MKKMHDVKTKRPGWKMTEYHDIQLNVAASILSCSYISHTTPTTLPVISPQQL